jgi:hypothetical protein
MNKTIHGFRLSKPEENGYPDKVQILNSDTGDMIVYECTRYRTNPNPYSPHGGQQWREVYAQIAKNAPTGIPYECVETPKHGKCIALNGMGPVPTTLPDPNNHGKMFAEAVLIHEGFSATWPGSMACQTVHPDDWPAFIDHFKLGEKGIYILTDEKIQP